jgi:hypothetical protein
VPYEYCCFVSYPHGQDDVLVPFVNDFVTGLEREIKTQTYKKVWSDKFLKGGHRVDEEIGPDLCKSACMILFYTPLYFDTEHTYCARELKAMQDLEEQRMQTIKDKGKGLIIPVILRGVKRFPSSLKEKRKYWDFSRKLLNKPDDKIQEMYAQEISEIAEYILDQCDLLEQDTQQVAHNCETYRLPSAEDAKTFVEIVIGKKIVAVPMEFPVRPSETDS